MGGNHYCCRLPFERGFDRWGLVAGGRIGVGVAVDQCAEVREWEENIKMSE